MKSILVTGGAGYIGSVLVKKLLKEGYRVVCLDNLSFGGESLLDVWDNKDFVFYKTDITHGEEVDKILRDEDIDGIVHLAAIVGDPACKMNPELATKINWDASVHLIDEAIENKISRFIFSSTCSNYGKMGKANQYLNEESTLAPVSLYAELKVKIENYLLDKTEQRDDFVPTALRFSTVYGLSSRMRFDLTVNEFAKELALGRELIVFGEQFWRPYCHVTDFSNAVLAVLEAPKEKVAYNVFNVGDTQENYTKKMIIEAIQKQISNCKIRYVEKKEDPRDYRVNFDKIKNVLGFSVSKTVPDGIKELKQVLEMGLIKDPDEQRFYNIPVA